MEPLTDMAIRILFGCMVQWNVEEMDDVQMQNSLELITYFDDLPYTLRDQVLTRFSRRSFWKYEIREPQAWDVAPFIYNHQRRLSLTFSNPNFDLEFLLQLSGHKLTNLTDLYLPRESALTASACTELCRIMPNLKKLHISQGVVDDDAAIHIAQLSLVELRISGTTQAFVRKLCAEDSALRKTLRVFQFLGKDISTDCRCFVLNTMTSIEDMGILDYSEWFKALLPLDSPPQQYKLRELDFDLTPRQWYPNDSIEDVLDIAVLTCPKVRRISIVSEVFTPKMLRSFTKFKELADLDACISESVTTNDAFDRLSLRDLYLEKLVELCMDGGLEVWVSSGLFFQLLDMCPNLEKLTLCRFYSFSDKLVREFVEFMAKKKLKSLMLDQCHYLLGPSAIEGLCKIESLVELDVILHINEINRQLIDAHTMQQTAERHGVYLQLQFYPAESDDWMDIEIDDDGGDVGDWIDMESDDDGDWIDIENDDDGGDWIDIESDDDDGGD